MHRADSFHCCGDAVDALRSELGSGEDVVIEKLNFVAAELLNVLAADARCRLREDLD